MYSTVTGATNDCGVAQDELPLERLYRWERQRADSVFLTQPCGGGRVRQWTFAQAAREIRSMAFYLKAQNWEPGSHVAILSKNCAWWVMADLAIWMAGHATVPVYPSLRAESVRHILEHSGAKACFLGATDERETAVEGIPPGVAVVRLPTGPAGSAPDWDTIVAKGPALEGNPVRGADELATIFYTSGTTGAPKGVMHRFATFSFQARILAARLGLPPGEPQRAISYLPLAHIFERGALEVPAMIHGWHVFFTEGLETFLTDMQRARPTIFLSVPRLMVKFRQGVYQKIPPKKLDRLLRLPLLGRSVRKRILAQLGLDAARHAACGAAPLSPDLLAWYRGLGLNLREGYGSTEAMITHLPVAGRVRAGYVGSPLNGVEARRDENGELLLRSPMNMLGYYKDPQSTRACFTEDGFYRTGDLVDFAPDGQMRIVGRLKEQFKTSKGKFVFPAPVETKLVAHPDIESCCLMGAGLAAPFAVAVLSPEAQQRSADPVLRSALDESLRQQLLHVNAELDLPERVRFIVIVRDQWTIANGLLTPTLKFKRAALEQRYMAHVDDWQSRNRPVVWAEDK